MAYTDTREDILASPPKLTPREQDCLQLLSTGLLTSEVRVELGISQSTLDAHLASARRKLDVRTTIQAVLRFAQDKPSYPQRPGEKGLAASAQSEGLSETQIALKDHLTRCQTFDQAWQAFHDYVAQFGVGALNFFLVADPDGMIEESNWTGRSSLPEEVMAQYREMGSVRTDPDAGPLIRSGLPKTIDLEEFYPALVAAPPPMRQMASLLIDNNACRQLGLPSRDTLTEAGFLGSFVFNGHSRKEFQSSVVAHTAELKQALQLFWDHTQRNAMLSRELKLTVREREALLFLARGFAVAEMAERIHVSQRAAEQFLARARQKLGARNNAQAIYRAMVYRALQ